MLPATHMGFGLDTLGTSKWGPQSTGIWNQQKMLFLEFYGWHFIQHCWMQTWNSRAEQSVICLARYRSFQTEMYQNGTNSILWLIKWTNSNHEASSLIYFYIPEHCPIFWFVPNQQFYHQISKFQIC